MKTINVARLYRVLDTGDVAAGEAAVVFTLKGATVATEYFEGKISTGYRQVVDDLPEFDAHSAVLGNGTQFEYSVSV